MRVAVVGAGIAGLAAAHRRIIELGGTLTSEDDAGIPTQTHHPIATPQFLS